MTRSSCFGLASATAIGSPVGVAMRWSRNLRRTGNACAVAVTGGAGKVGAFHGLTRAGAFDRGGIQQPHVVVPRRCTGWRAIG